MNDELESQLRATCFEHALKVDSKNQFVNKSIAELICDAETIWTWVSSGKEALVRFLKEEKPSGEYIDLTKIATGKTIDEFQASLSEKFKRMTDTKNMEEVHHLLINLKETAVKTSQYALAATARDIEKKLFPLT